MASKRRFSKASKSRRTPAGFPIPDSMRQDLKKKPYIMRDSIGGGFIAGGLGATRVRESDLYVTDGASENITHFTINQTDCTLTLDTRLYPSGDTGMIYGDSLTITPDGRTMFVGATGDKHIYSHKVASDGSLGKIFTEASTPDTPDGFEVSPDGHTLIANYVDKHQVCAYPISGDHHLGTPNCQDTVGAPTGVSIDRASKCVYAAEADFRGTEVAVFKLREGILGTPTEYNPFGIGIDSEGILVNWDNTAIYISNSYSATVTEGTISPGCKLTYEAIISDALGGSDEPGQIAQEKIVHGYVVTGDSRNRFQGASSMGIFQAHANGKLTPIGSGQFPLMGGVDTPLTVVVVGAK
jgi:DNA-binding beta-propeller fold protein YncE